MIFDKFRKKRSRSIDGKCGSCVYRQYKEYLIPNKWYTESYICTCKESKYYNNAMMATWTCPLQKSKKRKR